MIIHALVYHTVSVQAIGLSDLAPLIMCWAYFVVSELFKKYFRPVNRVR